MAMKKIQLPNLLLLSVFLTLTLAVRTSSLKQNSLSFSK